MDEKHPHNVILVDDHAMYSEGLRLTLKKCRTPQFNVIGVAKSGKEFFELLNTAEKIELVTLDIYLPDTSGVSIARQLKKEHPNIKILMLSSEVTPELIHELVDIGVEGYLSKMAGREEIVTAVTTIIGGNQYFGRRVSSLIYDMYINQMHGQKAEPEPEPKNIIPFFKRKAKSTPNKPKPAFTPREEEVIRMLCDGMMIKEIADKLGVSIRTVEVYKSAILEKLGFTRIADLIKYAIREGMIPL